MTNRPIASLLISVLGKVAFPSEKLSLILFIVLLLSINAFNSATLYANNLSDGIECENDKVCRIVDTRLPLKVLPRPFSNIYRTQRAMGDNVIANNIPALRPLYVFKRENINDSDSLNPKGWYHVGFSDKESVGWMQASDIIEWRQSLIVSYTHHGVDDEKRNLVLGFKDLEYLRSVAEDINRESIVKSIYEKLKTTTDLPELIIKEPSNFLDINEDFYMLPIIQWESLGFGDTTERYLKLVAAVPHGRADNPNEYTIRGTRGNPNLTTAHEKLSELGVDIVFVMDTTSSMGPFIDRTKQAIQNLAIGISQSVVKKRIQFGIVGYRDDHKAIPQLGYTVYNFTPSLVDSNTFVNILSSQVKHASVGSKDEQEEVFAGFKTGLESKWNSNSIRFIVLVGDASSHEVGHPQNTLGMSERELRTLATDANIYVVAMHLKHPNSVADHPIATKQFMVLSKNPGSEVSSYMEINAQNHDSYEVAVKTMNNRITTFVNAAASGASPDVISTAIQRTVNNQATNIADVVADVTTNVLKQALIDYLGDEIDPPRDVTFWALDHDLTDSSKKALEVNILLSRKELDDMIRALEAVVTALDEKELTGEGFIKTLQAVVTETMQDSGDIDFRDAKRLADSRLFPRWLGALPYKSRVQSLSDDAIQQLTPDERIELELNLEAKLSLYREFMADNDHWVSLNDEDERDALKHVYPIPIEDLP